MPEARESQIHFRWHRLLSRARGATAGSSYCCTEVGSCGYLWLSTAWCFTRCHTRGLCAGVERCKVSGMPSCTAATRQCGWSQCAQKSTSLELDLSISGWPLHTFMDLRDDADTYFQFFTCQEHDYIPLTQLLLLISNIWWMCPQFHSTVKWKAKKDKDRMCHQFQIKLFNHKIQ